MAKTDSLTAERLRELLHYDPLTGVFTWRVSRRGRRGTNPGSVAGTVRPDGYRVIGLDCARYLAHRLAWLYVHGVWPPRFIDHEDDNPSNNRISNLRPATKSQNAQNTPRLRSSNTSGFKGVSWDLSKQKWLSQLMINGKHIYIGRFTNVEDAIAARKRAEEKYHPFRPAIASDDL